MDEWLLASSVGKHNKIPFRTTGSSKPKVRITTHTLWPERVLRLARIFPSPLLATLAPNEPQISSSYSSRTSVS